VTVSLSGDGGDELLGGYNRYRYFYVLRALNHMPRLLRYTLSRFLEIAARIHPDFKFERTRELLSYEKLDPITLFERMSEKISYDDLKQMLNCEVYFEDISSDIRTRTGLSALQHFDIINYLETDILTKVDRASMACSLETRPPYLDHRFVEYCCSIDERLKIRGRSGKWILKRALKDILPKQILKRRKMGFAVPIKHYLRKELKDLVDKYVLAYDKHGLFNIDFLKDTEKKGKLKDISRLYWDVMMFNMWYERWMI
jgi:asparagine synthase (glutamine-hydrolysing)